MPVAARAGTRTARPQRIAVLTVRISASPPAASAAALAAKNEAMVASASPPQIAWARRRMEEPGMVGVPSGAKACAEAVRGVK